MLLILEEYFREYPARRKVAETLFNYGLSVKDGKVFIGDMEVPISAIAKFAGVNRKIVYHTIEYIEKDYALRSIFERVKPCVSLHELAPIMGWEVLEITLPPGMFGCILKDVLEILAEQACSMRQITGFEYVRQAGTVRIIVEDSIPIEAIEKIRDIKSVEGITLRTSEKDKEKLVCSHCRVEVCYRRI